MSQRTYAPDKHRIGHGGALAYCDTANGTFISIKGTTEVNLPERELGEADHTNDDSPDFTKEMMPGMFDPGSVSASYIYQPDQFEDLETIFQLATVAATRGSATKFWKHTLPDGAVVAFKGWIKKHDMPRDQEGTMTVSMEIRATTIFDWTAPPAS